jgi:hypothetical protein
MWRRIVGKYLSMYGFYEISVHIYQTAGPKFQKIVSNIHKQVPSTVAVLSKICPVTIKPIKMEMEISPRNFVKYY